MFISSRNICKTYPFINQQPGAFYYIHHSFGGAIFSTLLFAYLLACLLAEKCQKLWTDYHEILTRKYDRLQKSRINVGNDPEHIMST